MHLALKYFHQAEPEIIQNIRLSFHIADSANMTENIELVNGLISLKHVF